MERVGFNKSLHVGRPPPPGRVGNYERAGNCRKIEDWGELGGGVGFSFSRLAPPPHPPTPPFISQKPAKQRGKDTEYSFLREFAASSEFSSLTGGGWPADG
jgi:hypothetical protein